MSRRDVTLAVSVGKHFDAVARRTIGGVELACNGDTSEGMDYARRQVALCRAIAKP